MKELTAKLIFVLFDFCCIVLAITLAFLVRNTLTDLPLHNISLEQYLSFYPLYVLPLMLFLYEGIYHYRYDFWHESKLIIKGVLFAAFLIFAYLALTKSMQEYSRTAIGLAFFFMIMLLPPSKYFIKILLNKLGVWQKAAHIYGEDLFLEKEVFRNHYLGYRAVKEGEEASTVFVNSKQRDINVLKKIINTQIEEKHEVIFIPMLDDYDLTHSHIYQLSNTRTNLIVYNNRLKCRPRRIFQHLFNYILALILLPFILVVITILAVLIKNESPGPIFFAHNRVGEGGKTIPTLKFRSMYADAKERLEHLLATDPEAHKEWHKNFKLKNDPRVTKIGALMRKTSLDELPQIFNVLKGEMHFVGPRPVIQEEIDKYYKEDADYYYMVKPGITGLWQVSGRSDTNYDFRVQTDKWYVTNWSLWLDIVILFKTVRTVLKMEGAY